ncbi:MAG: fused MFS/spermidine synthase [Planctomycetes bacterium]|nr:fused MFS/spermidine synthase [Planctomycetota bacterium]MCB9904010.1 fused MFS/spermidine synthase [Planctomycetota bacterium]
MKRGGDGALLLLVAIAGAGTMVVELAAVRLLAPWYGASSTVWTNVIGVVLLALALGYLLGARWSTTPSPLRRLGAVLIAAGAFTAWLPFLAPLVARSFLPEGTTLDRAAMQIQWGSLACSLALFLPPALALGAVGPLAVEVDQRRRESHAGNAGGRVLAASTLGSLVGTFSTTHLLVPSLGLRASFLLAAFVLGGLGLVVSRVAGGGFRPTGAVALLATLGSVFAQPAGTALAAGTSKLAERQSPYQSVRVVERETDTGSWRELQVNEGFDSFQSVWQPTPGFLGSGYYYDFFVLPAWLDERRSGTWNTCVVGLGAGTAWRVLDTELPGSLQLTGVGFELDPVVVELGREYMDLPAEDSTRLRVFSGWDGRAGVRAAGVGFDQVILDAYANQVEIPAHLASLEFFREARAALRDGGWLSINVGAFGLEDPVLTGLARTVCAAFEQPVCLVRVPFSRNVALIAREGRPALPEDVPGGLPQNWSEWLAFGPATRAFDDRQDPLTDDRNDIERLQRESLQRAEESRR